MPKKRRHFKKKKGQDIELPRRDICLKLRRDPELQKARGHIRDLLSRAVNAGPPKAYPIIRNWLSMQLGWEFDTNQIKSIEEARMIYKKINWIADELWGKGRKKGL